MLECANGGSKAAKLLRAAVEGYIDKTISPGGHHRIVVRVYANLKGLRTGSNDSGPRSLAGFAAVFTREDSFFDFVDVGDADIVKSKILGSRKSTQGSFRYTDR